MRSNLISIILLLAAIIAGLLLCGCEEEIPPPPPRPTAASTTTPPPAQPDSTGYSRGGSSSLGKAKQTAGNIISGAEQRSREIADSAEDE